MVTTLRDPEAVKSALHAGQLTVTDPETGYHRSMYAACPTEGHDAPVYRIVREHGNEIAEVVVRCPICGNQFAAKPEDIYLR
jgi:hypothetical protein